MLLGSGNLLLGEMTPLELLGKQNEIWGGYTGEGDYRDANGNTEEVMLRAHSWEEVVSTKGMERGNSKEAPELRNILSGTSRLSTTKRLDSSIAQPV